MILLNTTFIVADNRLPEFEKWARETYLPALGDAGIFSSPLMARVLGCVEPGTTSIAIQAQAPDLAEATRWHDETASLLKDDLQARFQGQALFFTTYMEIL